jgi:hypothetical protein
VYPFYFTVHVPVTINIAPVFEGSIRTNFKIEVHKDHTGKVLEGESISYTSPKASDGEGDKIIMNFIGGVGLACFKIEH